MPTSGTHVTIVQRIALEAQFQQLLGNPEPTLPETDPQAVKMRFACLGSVGPDILYALGDYGGKQQDLENFLVKVAATFDTLGELMGKIGRYIDGIENAITLGVVDSLKQSTALVTGAINQGERPTRALCDPEHCVRNCAVDQRSVALAAAHRSDAPNQQHCCIRNKQSLTPLEVVAATRRFVAQAHRSL
jgi:hypothetical protein